jgi:hypothetical protein
MTERLGCPVVSLRSGNGPVFGLIYDQAQPPGLLLGARSLSVRLSPSTRERIRRERNLSSAPFRFVLALPLPI